MNRLEVQAKPKGWLFLSASVRQIYRQARSGKQKALGFPLVFIS